MKHAEILALLLSLVRSQIRRVNPEESTERLLTVEIGEKHNNDVVFENIHRKSFRNSVIRLIFRRKKNNFVNIRKEQNGFAIL